MAVTDKDTIYIDIDDEITGIIDKVKNSNGKVVALVLPKRASVFQSIVNMKLLKRAAASSKKNLVLITAEAGLLPLAGAAGIHVAKTLTSKPEIPIGPDDDLEGEEAVDEDAELNEELDKSKSLGALAGADAVAASKDGVETVVLDDEDLPPELDGKPKSKSFTPPKKDKKLKIPDFDRFRLLLIASGLLLFLLIVGGVVAAKVLPKATITIKTDARSLDINLDVNPSVAAKELNEEDGTIPAKLSQTQKSYTQQVPTTGQKNNGNKASGEVTITNCTGADVTLPAGTGYSSGGSTFIGQETVTVPDSNYKINGECKKDGKSGVDVIAQNGGSSYNLASGSGFAVAGRPASLSGQSGTISGGTDNIVKIVSQNDINSAKAKIVPNENELKQLLTDQLKKDKLYAIKETYSAGTPATTNSANVGDVADNVTVTENVTYTMFGVKQSELETLFKNAIKDQIDEDKQGILDNGLSKAVYNVDEINATGAKLAASTTAAAGPDLDIESIKKDAAGKKPGPVKEKLETNPDVTSVEVKLSPFWVSAVPNNTSKIKVDIAKPKASSEKSNSSDANNR